MDEAKKNNTVYEFGPFSLDAADYRLKRNGETVSVQPKVFELLLALLERRGHAVEKELLMGMLWPEVSVDEGSLTQLVFQLRKTLGETAAEQQYIETIPKRGYRFVPEVTVRQEFDRNPVPNIGPESERSLTNIEADQEFEEQFTNTTLSSPLSQEALHKRPPINPWLIGLFSAAVAIVGTLVLSVAVNRWIQKPKSGVTTAVQAIDYRKLTASGKAVLPALSPDGNLAAYVVDDMGKRAIWVRQIASTSRVQITGPDEKPILSLAFTVDGQSLYFVERDNAKNSETLFQIPVFGGLKKKILDDVNSYFSFSPDGNRFAFIRINKFSGETSLMIATSDGAQVQTLGIRRQPDFYSSYGVAWSPDGNVIACGIGRTDLHEVSRQIIAVNLSDGKEATVGNHTWEETGEIAWLRDGSGIIVNGLTRDSASFAFQLWHIPYPSGSTRKLFADVVNYEGISTANRSNLIAVGRSDRVSRIWLTAGDRPSEAWPISSSMSDNYSETFGLSWTSGGKIVYGSHGGGNTDIWIMDADGRNQKQLTGGTQREFWPIVSPDDRYIVYVSQDASGVHLWRMDIDGSNRKQLTFGKGESFPSLSPDGKTIFFSSKEPGWPAIGTVSIEGGKTRLFTEKRSTVPVLSPDGKSIACLYYDETTSTSVLALISTETGQPIKLFKDSESQPSSSCRMLRWTPDGKGLSFVSNRNGVSNIWIQPVAGGPPKQLTHFNEYKIYRFAWSRDGKYLAIDRGMNLNDVVLFTLSNTYLSELPEAETFAHSP
jgi:eukaryotic-like serine/threonine-protein kinase